MKNKENKHWFDAVNCLLLLASIASIYCAIWLDHWFWIKILISVVVLMFIVELVKRVIYED